MRNSRLYKLHSRFWLWLWAAVTGFVLLHTVFIQSRSLKEAGVELIYLSAVVGSFILAIHGIVHCVDRWLK